MRFGHFSVSQVHEIRAVLDELGVPYSIEEDPEALAVERERMKDPLLAYTGHPEMSHLMIEIPDVFVSRFGNRLEKYGITAQALEPVEAPSMEDYVCPTCRFSSPVADFCPQHGVALIEFSDFVKGKHDFESKYVHRAFWIIVAMCLMLVYLMYRTGYLHVLFEY